MEKNNYNNNRDDSSAMEKNNYNNNRVDSSVNVTQSIQNPSSYVLEGQPSGQQQNNYGGLNGIQYAASSSNHRLSSSACGFDYALSSLIDNDYDVYSPGLVRSAPSSSGLKALEHRFSNLGISSPSISFVPNGFSLMDHVTNNNGIDRTGLLPEQQRFEQIWSNSQYSSSYLSNGYGRGESSALGSRYRPNSIYLLDYARNNSSHMASTSRASRNPNSYGSSINNFRNFMSGGVGQSHQPFDYSRLSLKSLRGMIVYYAMKLPFSQFWKHALETASQEEIAMVFSELINEIVHLSAHPSATHIVQKLIERCNDQQRTEILLVMFNSGFLMLCIHEHGSYALRQLVKFLRSNDQLELFVTALCSVLVEVTRNVNGHHLIQDCLRHFPFYYSQVILIEASKYSIDMARDQHGCFVLQEFIRDSPNDLKVYFIADIIRNAVELSDHCYGNYVVQFVLGLGIEQCTSDLLQQLRGHYANLSCSKYGSHVVQMCLDQRLKHSEMIIQELLNDSTISKLINHPFGNFVIQSALSAAKNGRLYGVLTKLIRNNSQMMNTNRYGKKVLDWFAKHDPLMMNNPNNFRVLQCC